MTLFFLLNFNENSNSPSPSTKFQNEEEEATRNWQRKTAIVLLNSGNKRLLSGLVDSIANGIPCLGRASLVTVTWMSNFFCFIEDKGVQSLVYSELIPELIKLLKYNNAIEERVLASLSLLKLANNSGMGFCKLYYKIVCSTIKRKFKLLLLP